MITCSGKSRRQLPLISSCFIFLQCLLGAPAEDAEDAFWHRMPRDMWHRHCSDQHHWKDSAVNPHRGSKMPRKAVMHCGKSLFDCPLIHQPHVSLLLWLNIHLYDDLQIFLQGRIPSEAQQLCATWVSPITFIKWLPMLSPMLRETEQHTAFICLENYAWFYIK